MDINKAIAKALENEENYVGVSMEFSEDIVKQIKKYRFLKDISTYIENEQILTYADGTSFDNGMLLFVLKNMLEDGEAVITFTDKATKRNIDYLNKLMD